MASAASIPASDRPGPVPIGMSPVGAQIRVLRRMRRMTQQAFADRLGVSRSFVAHWETGRGGEAPYLEQAASILGVTPEVFLTGLAGRDSVETITGDEARLLQFYRTGDVAMRAAALWTVERLCTP